MSDRCVLDNHRRDHVCRVYHRQVLEHREYDDIRHVRPVSPRLRVPVRQFHSDRLIMSDSLRRRQRRRLRVLSRVLDGRVRQRKLHSLSGRHVLRHESCDERPDVCSVPDRSGQRGRGC